MVSSYKPELDVTPELDADKANFYQSQVGVLRWIIEMGRLDITTEVSMLAAHMAAPREGHLRAVYQVFAYLKNKHNARLIYDPTYPRIDRSQFKSDESWETFYGDVKEAIPPNAPAPRGRSVILQTVCGFRPCWKHDYKAVKNWICSVDQQCHSQLVFQEARFSGKLYIR